MLFVLMYLLLLVGLAVLGLESLGIAGSSALYPQVMVGTSLILMIVIGLQTRRASPAETDDPELATLAAGKTGAHTRFAVFCLIWLAYPLITPWTGFTLSTIAVLYGSILVFRTSHPWLSLMGIVCFAILFSVALKSIIYVPVPEAWPDQMINRLVYRFL